MPAGRPNRLNRLGRVAADAGGTLLFRKAGSRRLLRSRAVLTFAAILLPAELTNTAFNSNASWSLETGVLIAALAVLRTAFWLTAALALLEPALSLALQLAEDDPLELHWSGERRPEVRTACLAALSATLLLRAIILVVESIPGSVFPLADLVAMPIGVALLARIVSAGWRYSFTTALTIILGPALIALALATALANPLIAGVVLLLMLPLMWISTGDMRRRASARRAVKELLAADRTDTARFASAAQSILGANDPETAALLLSKVASFEMLPAESKVHLLIAAGRHLEAAEAGTAALERGETDAVLHLAMADACLRSDDPEDAAGHAEEAYERGGALEALLLLAVACFGMGERDSGADACRRILALGAKRDKRGSKAIVREARMLLRNFS
jgi:tetratricopeptide (TPR) repeat protein